MNGEAEGGRAAGGRSLEEEFRLRECELPNEAAATVVEVSETITAQGSTVRFKLHNKVAALDSLAVHLSMFAEPSHPGAQRPCRGRGRGSQLRYVRVERSLAD